MRDARREVGPVGESDGGVEERGRGGKRGVQDEGVVAGISPLDNEQGGKKKDEELEGAMDACGTCGRRPEERIVWIRRGLRQGSNALSSW